VSLRIAYVPPETAQLSHYQSSIVPKLVGEGWLPILTPASDIRLNKLVKHDFFYVTQEVATELGLDSDSCRNSLPHPQESPPNLDRCGSGQQT